MHIDDSVLVLEVHKQDTHLKMSIFEHKDIAQTLRHYSQLAFSPAGVNKLSLEIKTILNKADKNGVLEDESVAELKKTGGLLWSHLFTRQVKERLRASSIRNLILSLDDELLGFPWELAFDGDDFICLKFNLGRLVRTKAHEASPVYRSFNSSPRMLILANPTNDLKSAYLEGLHIKNRFERRHTEIRIDFKSTHIDTLFVKKNLRDYDIVHFAGHSEHDRGQAKNSGWVLNDGRFSVQDIFAMTEEKEMPALIFSNSCYSASSEEASHNLASAFLFSGVRHYIGTIRKIEDSVSLIFANEFYSHLISGIPVGESLRLARVKIIKRFGINAVSWASYLLYGDSNFIMFRGKHKQSKKPLISKQGLTRIKKSLPWVTTFAAISFAGYLIYMLMQSINPGSNFLFLKANNYLKGGKNQEAVSIAVELIKKDPSFLGAYTLLAKAYERQGKREEAIKCYFDYAIASEEKKDTRNQVSAYNAIGWLYQAMGDYPKALEFYNNALAAARENKDAFGEAVALRKLGVWHLDKGDYDKSLELLTKSSEINRENQHLKCHKYNLACDYFDIGIIFANKDDYKAAKEFYGKSAKLFTKLKLDNELSDCYFNLGEMYLFEKQYQKALAYYNRGLKLDQAQANLPSLASDYDMLGELYTEMGKFDEAEKFFEESLRISRSINAPLELASASLNLGLLYKEKGYRNKSREYLRLAQEIYSRIDTPDYQEIKKLYLE